MTKPEWGTKRDCPHCGARFYDLGKLPAHCPKCGTEYVASSKVSHSAAAQPKQHVEKKAPAAAPGPVAEGEEAAEEEIIAEDEDEELIDEEEFEEEAEAETFDPGEAEK